MTSDENFAYHPYDPFPLKKSYFLVQVYDIWSGYHEPSERFNNKISKMYWHHNGGHKNILFVHQ